MSPYLKMHADDAVKWQNLHRDTLEKAKKENKLIFVSIGFYSCYWCHVLQKESFRNKQVAQFLNTNMINIIVDRELNPEFDAYMLNFVKELTGRGGWPLNVILTPQAYPLTGFVYLPKDEFLGVLQQTLQEWNKDKKILSQSAQHLALQGRQQIQYQQISREQVQTLSHKLKNSVMASQDEFEGGFGQQSKFPHTPLLRALLCSGDKEYREWLKITLDNMAKKGLRDHVNGGFFRYTVDPAWQQPHFEKMLYDNAQLAELYFLAYREFRQAFYLDVAMDTVNFVRHQLTDSKDFGIYSSSSAINQKGEEGASYLYSDQALSKLFGAKEIPKIKQFWQLEVYRMENGGLAVPLEQKHPRYQQERMRLRVVHPPMPIDTKKISAWNALFLQALLTGYEVSGDNKLLASAHKLAAFLARHWLDGNYYRLLNPDSRVPGRLEDYAYTIWALGNYLRLTGKKHYAPLMEKLQKKAWQNYFDQGWKQNFLLSYLPNSALMPDSMLPSPSAVLINAAKKENRHATAALGLGWDLLNKRPLQHANHILNNLSPSHCP